MKYLSLGLDQAGNYLFESPEQAELTNALKARLQEESLKALAKSTATAGKMRSLSKTEIEQQHIDPSDPKSVGWTYLVHAKDPDLEEIKRIIRPLAEHRAMQNPDEPLLFEGDNIDEWHDWINEEYAALEMDNKIRPQYILIIGSAASVPFLFQSVLDVMANVGRVHFDCLDDLAVYAEKVIRLETAPEPAVDKEVLFFAPNGGKKDATYYSHEFMVKPLHEHSTKKLGFDSFTLMNKEATKKALAKALESRKPALVYTASHGLGDPSMSFEDQKRLNGSLICQYRWRLGVDDLFTADDVPMDKPFLEGAVFYQFACFGYGTPKISHYRHWLKKDIQQLTQADFIAALPKKLLAHPRGPIAYIGHLDTAFLHAFADPKEVKTMKSKWSSRLHPFKSSIDQLLGVQPSGIAMNQMNERYSHYNAYIANIEDKVKKDEYQWTEVKEARYRDTWIIRNDAQNYMIFGDPAARLRIPSGNLPV